MDLNSALGVTPGATAIWRGSQITTANRANTNIAVSATEIPLVAGARHVVVSSRAKQDFKLWILPQGAAAPSKTAPTDGAIYVNATGAAPARYEFAVDPADPPTVWVGENGGGDDTFDVLLLR